MEKTGFMVALAVTLSACGSVDGSLDAGSDAQTVDGGGGDVGLDVAVADAGVDASDPQCDGMPDFTACDDGRAWTLDGCIGGVCVGRVCSDNQVARNCNTAVLTLTSCEGVPLEDGTMCDDGDPFTANTTCTAGVCGGGDPCPCPPGEPCCVGDTCLFAAAGHSCDEWVELVCIGARVCGQDHEARLMRVYCSGDSPACDDAAQIVESGVNMCASDRRCVDGSYVPPDNDEQDVTIGCVPSTSC